MNAYDVLMALLRAEVCGGAVTEEVKAALTPQLLGSVYALAKGHDLAHIAGQALGKLGMLTNDETSNQFRRQTMLALMRHSQLDHEYAQICKTLAQAQISFIPLKGSVIRAYYPEGWMRTSCDVDILIHEADERTAIDSLVQTLKYAYSGQWFGTHSLHSPGGIHFELHCSCVEEDESEQVAQVLHGIWELTDPDPDCPGKRLLTDEMFYFYHIAHMVKHIKEGGCGIRPFMDLWILRHRVEHAPEKRDDLLRRGGLLTFARAAERLSEVWFSGAEMDPLSRQLARFVLGGGVYGNMENRVAVKQSQLDSRGKYLLSRIFEKYDVLQYRFPVLQKHKWLYPFAQVYRWIRLLFNGNMKRSVRELERNATVSRQESMSTAELLESLQIR